MVDIWKVRKIDKVIELAGTYYVVVGSGSIGILLGVCSLCIRYRKVRKLWARRVCLASDILNTTFVSITVVGVMTVSFELAIHLPDLARSQDIPEKVDLADLSTGQSDIRGDIEELRGSIPPQVDVLDLATRINRFIQEANRRRDLHSIIVGLHQTQALNENNLAREVGGVLGNMGAYNSIVLGGTLPESGVNWQCHNDGPFRCTVNR